MWLIFMALCITSLFPNITGNFRHKIECDVCRAKSNNVEFWLWRRRVCLVSKPSWIFGLYNLLQSSALFHEVSCAWLLLTFLPWRVCWWCHSSCCSCLSPSPFRNYPCVPCRTRKMKNCWHRFRISSSFSSSIQRTPSVPLPTQSSSAFSCHWPSSSRLTFQRDQRPQKTFSSPALFPFPGLHQSWAIAIVNDELESLAYLWEWMGYSEFSGSQRRKRLNRGQQAQ